MKKHPIKVNYLWILYGAVLVLLFLLSSTDWIIKEKEVEIYPISVIVGDASDEKYANFRKGMEQAAMEFNGDISFITLYEKGNAGQQGELAIREQEAGSRALIMMPIEDAVLARLYQENLLSVPIICVNTGPDVMAGAENMTVITFDFYAMGYRMGEEILKEHPDAETVCVLEEKQSDGAGGLFGEGVCEALKQAGCRVLSREFSDEGNTAQLLKELGKSRTGEGILVASGPESLLETAQLISGAGKEAQWVDGLYGLGNTVPLLNYLDKGVIQGLSVTDDFSAGYLSVKAAVDFLKNRSVESTGYLESYYIRREDLRNEKYEKMLYPIE